MEKNHFPLEVKENPRFLRIFQIIFGILCLAIAIVWIFINFKTLRNEATLWITIVFLVGFGTYQIAAGLGKITRFIEFEERKITLKQNSFLPKIDIMNTDLEKIEVYPLSIRFNLIKNKKFILRFGLNYTEIINPVKDAVIEFSQNNNIPLEEKREEL